MSTNYDVVIVGAGLQGLATARIFLQIEPDLNLLIVDSNKTMGGVWAKENLYPGLVTNNLLGTYEYTDFPMDETFGLKKEEHIPGEVAYEYFRRYAAHFDLMRRIEFRTKVTVAEKVQEGWGLELENVVEKGQIIDGREGFPLPAKKLVTCSKLVVATGLTSVPQPINIKGSDNFKAPTVNFGDYPREAPAIYKNETIQNVTVIGGGKAAYDIVYLMATHGKQVTWIIRASGHGPTYMAPAHIYIGPLRCWLEKLTTTRPLTWFSPCVWGDADGFGYVRNLLHGTRVGRWVVNKFWDKLGSDLIEQTGIAKHEETKKLMPDAPPFWYGVSLSILNYPTDIYDYVRSGQVKVLRKDVEGLEKDKTIRFKDGSSVQTGALICSMGWKFTPTIDFRPKKIHAGLGIPSSEFSKPQKELWGNLDSKADLEIFKRFPKLATGPKMDRDSLIVSEDLQTAAPTDKDGPRTEVSPWRLWRGIAPPSLSSRDLVFLGIFFQLQGAVRSEISSIWAYAYMNGKIKGPFTSVSKPSKELHLESKTRTEKQTPFEQKSEEDCILYDTALFNRFGKWRTPYGFGSRNPDVVFEGIAYFDLLLQDLGLNNWRKGWGWVGEVFGGSYVQADYRGLVEEWKETQTKKKD